MNGYQFIPESYSLDAYKFLFREGEMILRALGVSVLVTAVGTTLGDYFDNADGICAFKKQL